MNVIVITSRTCLLYRLGQVTSYDADSRLSFDIYGHAYFLEGGNEIGNHFENNLGFLVRFPDVAKISPNNTNDNKHLGEQLYWGDNNGNSYG